MEGFFTFLVGITCFGILLFMIYGIVAKISGRSIKNSGIVSGGQTIAEPEMLDNVGRGLRKLVDKKYKVRKQIEEEMNEELAKKIDPIDQLISTCSFMTAFKIQSYGVGSIRADQNFILDTIGFFDTLSKEPSLSIIAGRALTSNELEKVHQIHVELYQEKTRLTEEIIAKYNKKRDELLKYL